MSFLDSLRELNRVWVRGPRDDNTIVGLEQTRLSGLNRIEFSPGATGNHVELGEAAWLQNLRIRITGRDNRVVIGAGCKWKGYIVVHGKRRQVHIGDRSTCIESFIVCRQRNVTIGQECMLSRQVELRATDVHQVFDRDTNEQINPPADVVVGNGVWIAARAIVSKGSIIPDGCVVGAMSFVNRAFDEPNCVLAGVPARVVRRNIYWKR